MFIVFLKFGENKANAGEFMEAHKAWLKKGFDDNVFMLTGSLQPKLGGGVLANNTTREELESRVNEDPFVAEKVVSPEIFELEPSKANEKLSFLLG